MVLLQQYAEVILHITDPETLEAIAALAEDCWIGKVIVASDCLCVIKSINEMPRCPYIMILQEIYEKAKYFDFVRFVHESRDCNREAHTFAKYACTLRQTCVVGLPSGIPRCKCLIMKSPYFPLKKVL
jgi:hypothetical protein